MTPLTLILSLSMFIALLMTAGGIWLMSRQKVVVDDAGNVTDIEIPFFGKLKTNAPGVVAFFLGAALAGYAVNKAPTELDKIPLRIFVKAPSNAGIGGVIAGAIPSRYLTHVGSFDQARTAHVDLQVDRPDTYTVVALQILQVNDQGQTVYRVKYGPTVRITDPDGIEFAADFEVNP